jgi:hypothetical protein
MLMSLWKEVHITLLTIEFGTLTPPKFRLGHMTPLCLQNRTVNPHGGFSSIAGGFDDVGTRQLFQSGIASSAPLPRLAPWRAVEARRPVLALLPSSSLPPCGRRYEDAHATPQTRSPERRRAVVAGQQL